MAFFDRFKKKAEEVSRGVYHQLNPLDGGRTYSTNQRGVNPGSQFTAPTRSSFNISPAPQQSGLQVRGIQSQPALNVNTPKSPTLNVTPIQSVDLKVGNQTIKRDPNLTSLDNSDRIRELRTQSKPLSNIIRPFDANTASDRLHRLHRQQPETYRQQQFARGNNRPVDNIGEALFTSTARLPNTAKAGVGVGYGLAKIGANSVLGTDKSYKDTIRGVQDTARKDLSPNSGLFSAGTFFDNANDAATATPSKIMKKTLAGSVGIAGELAPIPAARAIKGGSVLNRANKVGAASAAANVAADAGNQYISNGQIDPKSLLKSAAGGYVLGAAVPVLGAAARSATRDGATLQKSTPNPTSRVPRVSIEDQQILRDYADALVGANKPNPRELSDLITLARGVGEKHGINLTTGSNGQHIDLAAGLLDQVGKKRQASLFRNEGGYLAGDEVPGVPPRKNQAGIQKAESGTQQGASSNDQLLSNTVNRRGLQDSSMSPLGDQSASAGTAQKGRISKDSPGVQEQNSLDPSFSRTPLSPAEQSRTLLETIPKNKQTTQVQIGTPEKSFGSRSKLARQLEGPENLISKMESAILSSANNTINNSSSKAKLSRYATKTVPESQYVSDDLARPVLADSPNYIPETNMGRLGDTAARIKEQGETRFTDDLANRLDVETGKISSQTVTDTQGIAAMLDAKGDEASLLKATELYTKLSEHLTAAGQTVQAAALIAKRSPQGLRFYAQKQLEKAGIKMTPEKTKELAGLIQKVKTAKPGTEAELIARDNVQYWIAKNVPSTTSDKIVNFWRSGLLTAPTTTGGALAGNAFATLQRKLWTNPIATMTDMVMSLGTGQRSRALASPGAFGKGLKRGADNVNPLGSKGEQYWKTGYDPMNPNATAETMGSNNRRINYGDGRMGRAMGTYVNGVYKLMGAADQPFRYGAFDEVMSSLARTEAINKGLKGQARTNFVKQFIANPPQSAVQRATDEAMDATFQNRTALADAVTSLKQGLKQKGHHKSAALVDFFIPFSGVPSSVASRVIRHTPIGTANTLVKEIFNVRRGENFDQRLMAQALAEGTAGVPIVAAGYALAMNDMFNGGYPTDPKERQKWTDENRQENSVKIGDRWYSLNYIQPFGTLLSVGAGIQQTEGKDGENPALNDYLKRATQSGVKSFAGQSYLEGVTAPLDAINDPEQEAGRYIAGAASGIVPNFIRSGARATDSVQRDASGVIDGVRGAIPGLRSSLPAKIGSDGNPLPNKDNFLNMYANPLKPSRARESNPVVQETSRLLDAGLGVSAAPVKKIDYGDKTVRLDKRQQEEYNIALGKLRTSEWKKAMNSLEYAYMDDTERQSTLQKISKDVNAVMKHTYATQVGETPNELTKAQQTLLYEPADYEAVSSDDTGRTENKTVSKKKAKTASTKKVASKRKATGSGRKGRKMRMPNFTTIGMGKTPNLKVTVNAPPVKKPVFKKPKKVASKKAGSKQA